MLSRWRGRLTGLAILAVVLGVTGVGLRAYPALVVTAANGEAIATIALTSGEFTLRYRNSVYRSLAEEHYRIDADGRIVLVGLAADELAVLEEYYAISTPAARAPPTGSRIWTAPPARAVLIEQLTVAATDLGRRTLLVDGESPVELWRLVDDGEPSVLLEVSTP